jgi:hypothetical protein
MPEILEAWSNEEFVIMRWPVIELKHIDTLQGIGQACPNAPF